MALPVELWQTARIIWENTAEISLDELVEQIREIFGDAPTKSTIHHRMQKESWTKKNNRKKIEQKIEQGDSEKHKNNKDEKGELALSFRTTQEKIDHRLNSLVLEADEKKKLIIKHRRRLIRLGELQDATLDTIDALNGLDAESDADKIKGTIVIANALSSTLEKLSSTQKNVFEQEMRVCGITDDDFVQSEQDRRMQSLEKLSGIHEQESQARANKIPMLMARLSEFERLEFEGLEHTSESDE